MKKRMEIKMKKKTYIFIEIVQINTGNQLYICFLEYINGK